MLGRILGVSYGNIALSAGFTGRPPAVFLGRLVYILPWLGVGCFKGARHLSQCGRFFLNCWLNSGTGTSTPYCKPDNPGLKPPPAKQFCSSSARSL